MISFYTPETISIAPISVNEYKLKVITDNKSIKKDLFNKVYYEMECPTCNTKITGQYIEVDGCYYHPECYQKTFGIICCINNKYINGSYYTDPYGNNAYTYHFDNLNAFHCQSCSVMYANYDNTTLQKQLCPSCYIDSKHSNQDIQNALKYVSYILKKTGIYPISLKASDIAVCSHQKMEGLSGDKITKGLAFVKQTNFSSTFEFSIYIIEHLPKIEFQAVLAHEIGHTWIADQGIKLPKQHEEGFCNLCSFLIYEDWNCTHGDLLIERLEKDTTPIYGNGFRAMKKQLFKKGWKQFLHELV